MSSKVEIAAALAAGSLHELRNLLAVVASSAYLAKQKQAEPAALALQLDKLERQIDRARTLVERLLAVAGGGPLDVEPSPVAELFEEARADLAPGPSVTLELSDPEGLEVACDRALLVRALANLIANAVSAVESVGGGTVSLRASRVGASVELAVSDDGPGFAGAPFDGSTTKPDGVGLGLLLARGIVEAHGGTLVAEPAPKGANLVVRLPAG